MLSREVKEFSLCLFKSTLTQTWCSNVGHLHARHLYLRERPQISTESVCGTRCRECGLTNGAHRRTLEALLKRRGATTTGRCHATQNTLKSTVFSRL